MSAVPESLLKHLERVVLNPVVNPADAQYAQDFGRSEFKSAAEVANDGVVWIFPAQSPETGRNLTGILIHELGHVLSKAHYGTELTTPAWQEWIANARADAFTSSAYANSSWYEDFAEGLALYEAVKGTRQERVQRQNMENRFRLIDQMCRLEDQA